MESAAYLPIKFAAREWREPLPIVEDFRLAEREADLDLTHVVVKNGVTYIQEEPSSWKIGSIGFDYVSLGE